MTNLKKIGFYHGFTVPGLHETLEDLKAKPSLLLWGETMTSYSYSDQCILSEFKNLTTKITDQEMIHCGDYEMSDMFMFKCAGKYYHRLKFKNCSLDRTPESLEGATSLEELTFIECTFSERAANGLMLTLKKSESITKILIYDGEKSVKNTPETTIIQALTSCKSLKDLDLFRARYSENSLCKLAASFPSMNSLQKVSLFNCGDLVCSALTKSLASSQVQELTLRGVSDCGAISLFESLAKNTVLVHLRLPDNKISNDVASSLKVTLSSPISALKELDLSGAELRSFSALCIAESLASNTSLNVLIIQNCLIDKHGCKALEESLAVNKSIQKIDLTGNPCDPSKINKILENEAEQRKKSSGAPKPAAPAIRKPGPVAQASSTSSAPLDPPASSLSAPEAAVDAWVDLARSVQKENPLKAGQTLDEIDTARARLDAAVARKDTAARDSAARAIVSHVRKLKPPSAKVRAMVDGLSAVNLDDPTPWGEVLRVYDFYTAAKMPVPFSAELHAHGTASLRLDLAHSLDVDDEKLAALREEADNLERALREAPTVLKNLEAATAQMAAKKRAQKHARRDVEDARDEGGPVEPFLATERQAREEYAKALKEHQNAAAQVHSLAATYWPEFLEHVPAPEIPDVDYASRDPNAYEDVENLATGRNLVWIKRFDGKEVVVKQFAVQEVGALRRELRALQRLSRVPGIVPVNAIFRGGLYIYIEMPLFKHRTLLDWTATNPDDGARLNAAQRLLIALAAVHQAGIVHCDIKPDNIFVDADGTPVLGDFDVSIDATARSQTLHAGSLGGTLGYIAPEVRNGVVTAAADVYSMGLTLLQLFEDGISVTPPPKPPVSLPAPVRALITLMLATEPDRRPTALEASHHSCFREVLKKHSILAIPPMYWSVSSTTGVHYQDVSPGLFNEVFQGVGGQIEKVQRVENTLLWRSYAARLDDLAWKTPAATRFPVTTATSIELAASLREDVNEAYLFHGTSFDHVSKIVRDGFDMRLGRGLYGFGTYFAEDPRKSHNYTCPDSSGHRFMIVSRVVLGRPATTSVHCNDARRPPCVEGHFDPHHCSHSRADSIVSQTTPREFIIYDLHQSYPEFLIIYKK